MVNSWKLRYQEKKEFYWGLCIVVVFYGILHCFTRQGLLDDPIFSGYSERYTLLEFLSMRYETWTSRVLLEGVTAVVLQFPFWVWQVCDTLAYGILYICIHRIMDIGGKRDNAFYGSIFLAMALGSYIMLQMASAGWGATSVNFMWTLAAAWGCLVLLQNAMQRRKASPAGTAGYILLMLFACNNEVTVCVLFLVYLTLMAAFWKKDAPKGRLYGGLILQTSSLIFILTSPGNGERLAQAVNLEYERLTIIGKLRIGIVSTFEHFVSIPNILFGVFCLVLALGAWEYGKNRRERILMVLPLLIDISLTGYYFVKDIVLGGKRNYVFDEPAMLPSSGSEWFRQWLLVSLLVVLAGSACFGMYRMLKDNRRFALILLILLAGFASRMAMAFTPSVYASGTRTFAMLYFCIAASTAVLGMELRGRAAKGFCLFLLGVGMLVNMVLTVIPYLQNYS